MNQIIEPKDPMQHGSIEMQSGHQEISVDARNNEYDVMNQEAQQQQQPYFRAGGQNQAMNSQSTSVMSKRLMKGKQQQPAPNTDALVPLPDSNQKG